MRTGLAHSEGHGSICSADYYYLASPSLNLGPKLGRGWGDGAKQKPGRGELSSCPPRPSPSLPLTPFNLLLLCAPTTEPAPSPCEPSLAAMPLPRAPLDPQRPFHHASAPCPAPLPNMCGAHGLLPRPGAASRGQETEISPLGRFSSAQRAWGLCRAPLSSPHASSR